MIYDRYKIIARIKLNREIIEAAKFSKPFLLFHGTSSKFLSSILKHGLIPYTKEGGWIKEDSGASENQRSRVSYGGIYFTNNLGTAISAATNLIIHQENLNRKSNTIVVCAMIQPQTTIDDEDNYKFRLISEQIVKPILPYVLTLARAGIKTQGFAETTKLITKNIQALINKFELNYNKRKDKTKLYSIAREVILTELERQIAYNSIRTGNKSYYSSEQELHKIFDNLRVGNKQYSYFDPLPKKIRPLDTTKAEQRARQALDLFIKATKNYSASALKEAEEKEYKHGSARIMTPVTFRGANKIVCIVELINSSKEKSYKTSIRLIYGKIPAEFKRQYIQSIGSWPNKIESSVSLDLGETPIPKNKIRRFHVTSINNLEKIKHEGLKYGSGKAIEGPKGIYSWDNINDAKSYANYPSNKHSIIVEFYDDAKHYEGHPYISVNDVPPKNIVAIHNSWHDKYRYAKENNISIEELREVQDSDYDKIADELEKKKIESTVSDNIKLQLVDTPDRLVNPFDQSISTIYKYKIFKNHVFMNALVTIIIDSKNSNKGYLIIDGEAKNKLGTVGMRQVLKQIKFHLPNLDMIHGKRISGAKKLWSKNDKSIVYDLSKAHIIRYG